MDQPYGDRPVIYDANGRPIQGSYDGSALPHVLTHVAIFGSAWQTYLHGAYDEAMRQSRDNALEMRRDAFLMALLQERKLATASLKWHLEVDDERDALQKALKDHLTVVCRRTPRLQQMFMNLLEAVWYGRYGSVQTYAWKVVNGRRSLVTVKHRALNGDKVGHHWNGTPYVLINQAASEDLPPGIKFASTLGWAMFLSGTWRQRFVLHMHESDDADYFEAERGDAIHGIGIRDRINWLNWLKREYLAMLVDHLERFGLGTSIGYYDESNPQSKKNVDTAMRGLNRRQYLLLPMSRNQRGQTVGGFERVDTPTNGGELLLRLQDYVDNTIERYVIGQTLSSDSEGSGLGGTGVAGLHAKTKHRIIAYDANNLAETLTEDWIEVLKRWNFPGVDFPVRFVFDLEDPESKDKLDAVTAAAGLGVEFLKNEVRALTGLSDPQPGDDVVGGQIMTPGGPGDAFGENGEQGGDRAQHQAGGKGGKAAPAGKGDSPEHGKEGGGQNPEEEVRKAA